MMNGWPVWTERLRPWACVLGLLLWSAPALADWREQALAEDHARIEQAAERAATVLSAIDAQDYGYDETAATRALLQARAMPRPQSRLPGDWRCRSIQLNDYGLFSYPWFRCHIELGADGGLEFRKSSGSQRRSGVLLAAGEGRWVFLGGRHVNDDPPRRYSALDADGLREEDSVGVLETLADGRLRMILDAGDGQAELYELMR